MSNLHNLIQTVSNVFQKHFGNAPTHLIQAPGRVNLIGEHTDYNDGFVFPCAINYQTVVAAQKRTDNIVRVIAVDFDEASDEFTISEKIEPSDTLWANYIRGVVQFLHQRGYEFSGADIVVSGNVPLGAGLSSSAALEVVIGQTFKELYGLNISQADIALNGQQAENEYVGCNCGIMDQLISAKGEDSKALLIDCRDLSTQAFSIPDSLAVMIINSNKKRGLVDSEYNTRREQCESAAKQLGVKALRDATLTDLQQSSIPLDSDTFKRARHVISENDRTVAMADALKNSDIAKISQLMRASHNSMRDDFEITVPEIDFLVETIDKALGNTGGVRMTGGGFGGCVVALVPHSRIEEIQLLIADTYEKQTGLKESIYLCQPSAGAGLVW
ncbi:MAG: galactokinase [Gammaproteobacteria bacterium]|nr:galactokinase [Gammaproteobacteria bacterium]